MIDLNRRRVMPLAAMTAVSIAVLLVPGPTAAQAHTSTYCGHGTDGLVNRTVYVKNNGYPSGHPYHQHLYLHEMAWGSDHWVWKNC